MRYHEMGTLLDHPTRGARFRRLLCETVLATDMSVHAKFMNEFEALTDGDNDLVCRRQILICQALMKCADISNPVSIFWRFCLSFLVSCFCSDQRFFFFFRVGPILFQSIGLVRLWRSGHHRLCLRSIFIYPRLFSHQTALSTLPNPKFSSSPHLQNHF